MRGGGMLRPRGQSTVTQEICREEENQTQVSAVPIRHADLCSGTPVQLLASWFFSVSLSFSRSWKCNSFLRAETRSTSWLASCTVFLGKYFSRSISQGSLVLCTCLPTHERVSMFPAPVFPVTLLPGPGQFPACWKPRPASVPARTRESH